MIRRHPHVFGDEQARSGGVAKGFWEANKAKERAAQGKTSERLLAGVPLALPGLTRAHKLQAKAAKVGFDWPHVDHVYDKISEELAELKDAPLKSVRRNWATCSSSWRISPATTASIRKQHCVVPTRNSSAALPTSRTL